MAPDIAREATYILYNTMGIGIVSTIGAAILDGPKWLKLMTVCLLELVIFMVYGLAFSVLMHRVS